MKPTKVMIFSDLPDSQIRNLRLKITESQPFVTFGTPKSVLGKSLHTIHIEYIFPRESKFLGESDETDESYPVFRFTRRLKPEAFDGSCGFFDC